MERVLRDSRSVNEYNTGKKSCLFCLFAWVTELKHCQSKHTNAIDTSNRLVTDIILSLHIRFVDSTRSDLYHKQFNVIRIWVESIHRKSLRQKVIESRITPKNWSILHHGSKKPSEVFLGNIYAIFVFGLNIYHEFVFSHPVWIALGGESRKFTTALKMLSVISHIDRCSKEDKEKPFEFWLVGMIFIFVLYPTDFVYRYAHQVDVSSTMFFVFIHKFMKAVGKRNNIVKTRLTTMWHVISESFHRMNRPLTLRGLWREAWSWKFFFLLDNEIKRTQRTR